MEDFYDGDDFGDIYAGVEAPVINGDINRTTDHNNDDADEKCDMDEDFVADSKKFGCLSDECEIPGVEMDEKLIFSDSEDDLNIVLNDDDFLGGSRSLGFVGGGYGDSDFNGDGLLD